MEWLTLVVFFLFGALIFTIVIADTRLSLHRALKRLESLESLTAKQRDLIEVLSRRVAALEGTAKPAATPAPAPPTPVAQPAPAPVIPAAAPARPVVTEPVVTEPVAPKPAIPAVPAHPPVVLPPKLPALPSPPKPRLDLENLIGVRLFAAVSGIALLIGAVLFLLYSVEHGWLQPPVRVAIGVILSVTLLVVCERKAARKYVATANAMDGSAIAILFSTVFAAHALWNLLPATPTFLLLGVVTALAVVISLRHDSLFIAVLGLVGGFLAPALLSTGENRPITLFSYLVLLNVGLAWVAYRKRWPLLTVLSTLLTAIYQWGWVLKFLDESSLSLAMGIFLLFPLVTMGALVLGGRSRTADGASQTFERASLAATAFPLSFSLYLAAVPGYGAHAGLLFGFLAMVDAGLFAVAVARREGRLHFVGGVSTLLVTGLWLAQGYTSSAWTTADACIGILVVLYAVAPAIARIARRPLAGDGQWATYTAPLLLVAFAVLGREPEAATHPLALFSTLFALGGIIAWQAIASRAGALHFVGAFFMLAAIATWSAVHLTVDSQPFAMWVYGAFGVFALMVPVLARRWNRPLEPRQGSGLVLLASLGLLLFLSTGPVEALSLWGFAILLSILNAAIFVESAAGRMPAVAIGGGLLSWAVLGVWWPRAVSAVGLVPAITLVVVLALIMLAGHTWAHRLAERRSPATGTTAEPVRFRDGLFLSLIAHAFLLYAAMGAEHTGGRPAVFIRAHRADAGDECGDAPDAHGRAARRWSGCHERGCRRVVRVRRRERHHNRHCRHRGRFGLCAGLDDCVRTRRARESRAGGISRRCAVRRRNGGDPHDAALTGDQRDAAGRNPRDQSRGARRVVVAAAMAGGGFGGHGALLVCHGNDGDCRPGSIPRGASC